MEGGRWRGREVGNGWMSSGEEMNRGEGEGAASEEREKREGGGKQMEPE